MKAPFFPVPCNLRKKDGSRSGRKQLCMCHFTMSSRGRERTNRNQLCRENYGSSTDQRRTIFSEDALFICWSIHAMSYEWRFRRCVSHFLGPWQTSQRRRGRNNCQEQMWRFPRRRYCILISVALARTRSVFWQWCSAKQGNLIGSFHFIFALPYKLKMKDLRKEERGTKWRFFLLGEGLAVFKKWSICQFLCSSHVYFYHLGSKLLFFITEWVWKVYTELCWWQSLTLRSNVWKFITHARLCTMLNLGHFALAGFLEV